MWRLSHEKRVSLIDCLVEGNSMRATARICKVGLNTVVRFLREIGPLADQYHHENIRGVVANASNLTRFGHSSRRRRSAHRSFARLGLATSGCGRRWTPIRS